MAREDAEKIQGTLLTRETTITPTDSNDYEYPFPDDANDLLYEKYADWARSIQGLLICGRLGEYRYYDMDQAIARAQVLAERVLAGDGSQMVGSERREAQER
jgi:UDP-galactopyranose mutase